MSFLEVCDLHKSYGPPEARVVALDGINLTVAAGGRTAIVGPSGCGKTTLLRLIAGFEKPDSGRITLDGEALAGNGETVPAYKRGIGLVAQDGALFPHLTIADNIGFGMPRNAEKRMERITELAYTVGLSASTLKRRPHQLSGGQQQRVALARALARKPKLMLLDEPFSALDTGLRASMRKAVAELLERAGIASILVTHDQAEALSFANQVAVMRDGRFSQIGSPRDLYLKPVDRMVAEFLGDAVILPAQAQDGFAQCSLGRIPLNSGERRDLARIMLRPEQIRLEPAAPEQPATAGVILARVVETEFAGASCTIAVQLLNSPDPPDAIAIGNTPLVVRQPGLAAPATGDTVQVLVSGKAHLLN